MQPAVQITTRPDLDIEEDITLALRNYSPLKAARGFLTYQSIHGHVKVSGNVGSLPTKQVLLNAIKKIPGVLACDSSDLHDDEEIRLAVGQLVPDGLQVNVQCGTVILIGTLPDNSPELLDKVHAVPGVRKVVTNHPAVN